MFDIINRSHRSLARVELNDEQIRTQAYALWQQEYCPSGRALDHWLAAEEIVRRRHREGGRVQLRYREKMPLLNVEEVAEVL